MSKCEYNLGSNFDRQGQWIIAKYMGKCFVTGVVQETRVKYGGAVQHTIISDSPAVLRLSIDAKAYEVRPIGTTFLVEEKDVDHSEFFVEQAESGV
jgi:hypothetical protein